MAICLMEIVEHMIIIIAILYENFYDDMASQVLARLADFVVIMKNALNFPIFLLFNKLFSECFFNSICRKEKT